MMGASDVVYRSRSRYNGWSCPPHGFQFIAWGAYLYFAIFYFTCAVPSLLDKWQPVTYVIMAVFLVVHIVVHLLACSINPADIAVLQKMRKGQRDVGQFDRSRHRHVIENQHCYLCEVDVGLRSKHCSTCNKCVSDFDHHCKWLNNCVGGRNYRLFIATLVSAIAGCLTILILCLVQFVAYYNDKQKGHILKPYQEFLKETENSSYVSEVSSTGVPPASAEFKLFYQTVPDLAWQILIMFTVVLAGLGTGLLAHLLGFHIYLMCKGLNTYDYIIQEREKSEKAAREKEIEESGNDTTRSRNKHNRVRPDATELSGRITSRGGIDESAVMETAQLSSATAAVTTLPPSPHITQRDGYHTYHEGPPQRRKKKKKTKKMPSTYIGRNEMSPVGNSGPAGNGHLASKELEEAVRKSLEQEKNDGMFSDDTLGPSSVQDVAVNVKSKRESPATDSQSHSSRAYHRPQHRPYHTLPGIGKSGSVVRASYDSSDSDTGDSLCEIPVNHTVHGAISATSPIVAASFQRSASLRALTPPDLASHAPMAKASLVKNNKSSHGKHKRKMKDGGHRGEVNKGANLSDNDQDCGDAPTEGPSNSVRVSTDFEVTPRPPRHKDVPPLDLSPFHNDSEQEPSTRRKNATTKPTTTTNYHQKKQHQYPHGNIDGNQQI